MSHPRRLPAVAGILALGILGITGIAALSAGATVPLAPPAPDHVDLAPLSPLADSKAQIINIEWVPTTSSRFVAEASSVFVGTVVAKGDSFQVTASTADAPSLGYHKVRFSVSSVFRGPNVNTIDVVVRDGGDGFVQGNRYVVYAAPQVIAGSTYLLAQNRYGAFVVGADNRVSDRAWGDDVWTSVGNPLSVKVGAPSVSVSVERASLQRHADEPSSSSLFAGGTDSAVASAAAASGNDFRTGAVWWYISGGVPSSWYTAIINGALVWDNVTGQSHDFNRQFTLDGAQINVWAATSGQLPSSTLADTTWYKPPGPRISIAINGSSVSWWTNTTSTPSGGYYDLWSVMAHEFGHTLHLDEAQAYVSCGSYSLSTRPTMCQGLGSGQSWKRSLQTYDQNHERSLYPG